VGPLAQQLISGQQPLNVYAPFRALAEAGGWVVLMGVGPDKLTLLHYAEQLAGRIPFRRWANDPAGPSRSRPAAAPMALRILDPFSRLSSKKPLSDRVLGMFFRPKQRWNSRPAPSGSSLPSLTALTPIVTAVMMPWPAGLFFNQRAAHDIYQ